MNSIINILTVDVEEYYHGLEFEAAVPPDVRRNLPSRVEGSVERVLRLLDAARTQATFFVVGCVARQHPAMIKQIAAAGHEVACHSDAHELVSRQTIAEFREDVRRAKGTLEDLIGTAMLGYRAPNYSITEDNAAAFDVLLEEGFSYDSSVYPIQHDRYGFPSAPRFPYVMREKDGRNLWELPLGTVRAFRVNFPIGGGGFFRLLPYRFFRTCIRRVNKRERQPVTFYFHPWELDPGQPRPAMPAMHRFRHYVNLHRTEGKLRHLIHDVPFAPARDVLSLSATVHAR